MSICIQISCLLLRVNISSITISDFQLLPNPPLPLTHIYCVPSCRGPVITIQGLPHGEGLTCFIDSKNYEQK